mmetsp:Transcript_70780/g.112477  ORF Transcript_70780/g.112477 Transcript_70780/m.112477 type:complete len:216 (+) Transcript_70780:60-707(+)
MHRLQKLANSKQTAQGNTNFHHLDIDSYLSHMRHGHGAHFLRLWVDGGNKLIRNGHILEVVICRGSGHRDIHIRGHRGDNLWLFIQQLLEQHNARSRAFIHIDGRRSLLDVQRSTFGIDHIHRRQHLLNLHLHLLARINGHRLHFGGNAESGILAVANINLVLESSVLDLLHALRIIFHPNSKSLLTNRRRFRWFGRRFLGRCRCLRLGGRRHFS